jgi:hypothetical protein
MTTKPRQGIDRKKPFKSSRVQEFKRKDRGKRAVVNTVTGQGNPSVRGRRISG